MPGSVPERFQLNAVGGIRNDVVFVSGGTTIAAMAMPKVTHVAVLAQMQRQCHLRDEEVLAAASAIIIITMLKILLHFFFLCFYFLNYFYYYHFYYYLFVLLILFMF